MISIPGAVTRLIEDKKSRYLRAFSKYPLIFLRALWGKKGGVFFVPFAKFHEYIVDRINNTKKLITLVMVPRRFGKTKLISFGYIMWAVTFKRYSYVLHISHDLKEKGEQIMRDLQRGFKSKAFIDIFGDWQGKFWGQHKIHLYSQKWRIDCVIEMRGIAQSVFGASEWKSRPDLIILDDIETLKSVRNKDLIQQMLDKFKTEIIPAAETKDESGRRAKIIIIGTPLAAHTFLTVVAGWDKYVEVVKFSALVNSKSAKSEPYSVRHMGEILELAEEKSIWEDRWSTEKLWMERQFWIDTNSFGVWCSQYMMDPITDAPLQFRREKIEGHEIEFKDIQKLIISNKVVITCDTAFTESTQNDACGINASMHLKGSKIVSLESHEIRVTQDKLFDFLYALKLKYEKAADVIVAVEIRQYDLLKRYFWEISTRTGRPLDLMPLYDKNRSKHGNRIAGLIPFYEVGLLDFVKGQNDPLFSQMWTWFGKSSGHDDVLDAYSYQQEFVEISDDVAKEFKRPEKETTSMEEELGEELPDKLSASMLLERYDKECEEKEEEEEEDADFDRYDY